MTRLKKKKKKLIDGMYIIIIERYSRSKQYKQKPEIGFRQNDFFFFFFQYISSNRREKNDCTSV